MHILSLDINFKSMYEVIYFDSDIIILKENVEVIRMTQNNFLSKKYKIFDKNQILLSYKYLDFVIYEYIKPLGGIYLDKFNFKNNPFNITLIYEQELIEVKFFWFPFLRKKIGQILLNKVEIASISNENPLSMNINFLKGYGKYEIVSLIFFLIKHNYNYDWA